MSKIDRLTSEQETRFAEIREEWLVVGLSTQPTDRAAAERAVDRVYECAGLPAPKVKVWLRSPLEGAIGAAYLDALAKNPQVGGQVRDQVWDQVWDQVGGQVWDQVRDQVGDQVGGQVWDQVRDQVWGQVGGQVWGQVRDQVWGQVGGQVRGQVWDQVGDQVGDQVRGQVRDQVRRAAYGQHDAGWLSFYDYMGRVVGIDVSKLRGLMDLARHAGWFWSFREAVILTERPVMLTRDSDGRLHGESDAAIKYGDGWGVYAWHGLRVPEDVITHPEAITVGRIEAEQNAEQRRVLVERYGMGRYLKDAGATKVHEDETGILWRKGDMVMVQVSNSTPEPDGSRREYFLAVHPELRPIRNRRVIGEPQALTARNAVASTFGLRGEGYRPKAES